MGVAIDEGGGGGENHSHIMLTLAGSPDSPYSS